MTEFELQLLRLKECLRVTEDQAVAAALGISKAALSDRKRRQAFPAELLIGLVAKYPEIDVHYVLTGKREHRGGSQSPDIEQLLARLEDPDLIDAMRSILSPATRAAVEAAIYPPVRALLQILESCDDATIDLLTDLASRLRGRVRVPFSERERRVPDRERLRTLFHELVGDAAAEPGTARGSRRQPLKPRLAAPKKG